MTRKHRAPGEKPLFWAGSSREDLLEFPDRVRDHIGTALSVAQFGGRHPDAKPWKGQGPGVLEIVEDHRGDIYRAVLHRTICGGDLRANAFQEKSPHGMITSRRDVELVSRRLRAAPNDYEVW